MADRSPRNPWRHFFIGTPGNFLRTFGFAFVILAMLWPQTTLTLSGNVLAVVMPAAEPYVDILLKLFFVVFGFGLILGFFRPKKKKKDSH